MRRRSRSSSSSTARARRPPLARTHALVLGLLLAAGVLAALLLGERPPEPLSVGAAAPGFALERLDGGEPLALADQRGHVVFLNFWATWCKPCEDEMPAMERLHRALAPDGLTTWAVSVDVGRAEVEAFRDRLGLSFPILHDPDREVAGLYQSFRFPETWLIDADGVLAARFIGPRDWDDPAYADQIRELLAAAAEPGEGP